MHILDTKNDFKNNQIAKPEFIKVMYELHHSKLFEYAEYIKQTNIKSIEIFDDQVIMTFRDIGVKIICPFGDHRVAPVETLNFLHYEPDDSEMIFNLISPTDCVVDIGANIGWYSINIAKRYPLSKVYAFEPIPKTYSFLESNINLNSLNNVKPLNFGLSNEEKDITFYFYSEGGVNASAANLSERKDAELITCHVMSLDKYVKENSLKVDFIKCDVEGAELFAFQGARETLELHKPIVFTEMLRKWAAKFNYHPNQIIKLFSDLDYRCFYAENGKLVEIYEMTENTLQTNFFFLNAIKHASQIDAHQTT